MATIVALFDSKLLWRANLYIDDGPQDWNNTHPWNAPPDAGWGVNEWFVSKQDGADVDGGQINIRPWTRFSDSGKVAGSVAYSKGCADAVDHFNSDMDDQDAALTASGQPGGRANPTYAPTQQKSVWSSYIFGVPFTYTYPNGTKETRYNKPTYNGQSYPAYTPGFSSWRTNNGGYDAIDTGYSAGVDCSGFVQRCLKYNGSPYTQIPGVGGRLAWGDITPELIGPGFGGANPDGFESDTYSYTIGDLNRLIPGDIVSCDGHVGIVTGIDYTSDNQVIEGNVTILESAGDPQWRVRNDRTLQQWLSAPSVFPNITLRRMKVGQ